jgi:hypothetical protein
MNRREFLKSIIPMMATVGFSMVLPGLSAAD